MKNSIFGRDAARRAAVCGEATMNSRRRALAKKPAAMRDDLGSPGAIVTSAGS